MSLPEPVLFPCPKCGTGRGEGGVRCKQCGWSPDAVKIPTSSKSEPYSKFAAMLVGFPTMLPIAYVFFFFAIMMITVSRDSAPDSSSFNLLVVLHFGAIILTWCLIAFYIYYLFKTDHVKQDQKALWAVVLFFGNVFAMPIFWYLYVWKPADNAY